MAYRWAGSVIPRPRRPDAVPTVQAARGGFLRLGDTDAARHRTRALGAFYAAGSALLLVALVVPSWLGQDRGLLLGTALVAGAVGFALFVAGPRVPMWVCQCLVAVGSGLIALCLLAGRGGAATATWSFFYVWVAVYSACYFALAAIVAQVGLAAVLETLAISAVGDGNNAPAQIVVSVGTCVAAAMVVGSLVRRVSDLAGRDALTGLANRRTLDDALTTVLARARRTGEAVAVLAIDLNGFKAVNDTLGHTEGDRLLVELGRIWSSQLRRGDVLARTGGDEFVMVLPMCRAEHADDVARRLQSLTPLPLSTSVGIALTRPSESAREVLLRADAALYAAKPQRSKATAADADVGRVSARRAEAAFPSPPLDG